MTMTEQPDRLAEIQARIAAKYVRQAEDGPVIDASSAFEDVEWLAAQLTALREENERLNKRWLCDCHTWPSPDEAHAYIVALEARDVAQREKIEALRAFCEDVSYRYGETRLGVKARAALALFSETQSAIASGDLDALTAQLAASAEAQADALMASLPQAQPDRTK